jgi:hypothetical protein
MKVQDFRNHHLLLDEQAEQIFAMTGDVAGASAQDRRNYAPRHWQHIRT